MCSQSGSWNRKPRELSRHRDVPRPTKLGDNEDSEAPAGGGRGSRFIRKFVAARDGHSRSPSPGCSDSWHHHDGRRCCRDPVATAFLMVTPETRATAVSRNRDRPTRVVLTLNTIGCATKGFPLAPNRRSTPLLPCDKPLRISFRKHDSAVGGRDVNHRPERCPNSIEDLRR